MEPPINFDDFLNSIGGMEPEAQYEMLLRYVSAAIELRTTPQLVELRDILRHVLPDDEHRATLVEVIGGKIALRAIMEPPLR